MSGSLQEHVGNLEFVNGDAQPQPGHHLEYHGGGFQFKVSALYLTHFDEVRPRNKRSRWHRIRLAGTAEHTLLRHPPASRAPSTGSSTLWGDGTPSPWRPAVQTCHAVLGPLEPRGIAAVSPPPPGGACSTLVPLWAAGIWFLSGRPEFFYIIISVCIC
jgi:hypothetical protein